MRRRIMVRRHNQLKNASAKRIEAQHYTSSHFVIGCDD
jgi:hypothetical protein